MAEQAPSLTVRVDAIGIASLFNNTAGDVLAARLAETRSQDVRLRFAAQSSDLKALNLLLDEVEALYCVGPAGGGGVRRHLTARLSSASCLVERAFTQPRATLLEDAA